MNEEEITQYNQCSEDWRHYDRAIWQMPTVAITIASAILAVAYQYVKYLPARAFILLLGGLLLLSLTVALVKHRLFQEQRIEFLSDTEKDWVDSDTVNRTIKRKTTEVQKIPWYGQKLPCCKKQKGYYWLLSTMIIATSCLFGLSIYNFIIHIRC
jgi:hypothetical protein